jgi:hypothetical protein
LRRVETVLAVVEPHEERVAVRQLVIDATGERVVGDFAIGCRDVIVEAAASRVRERVDAGDVAADRLIRLAADDVVGKRIAGRCVLPPGGWSDGS